MEKQIQKSDSQKSSSFIKLFRKTAAASLVVGIGALSGCSANVSPSPIIVQPVPSPRFVSPPVYLLYPPHVYIQPRCYDRDDFHCIRR